MTLRSESTGLRSVARSAAASVQVSLPSVVAGPRSIFLPLSLSLSIDGVLLAAVQVTQRQLKKELRLPEFADVDRVEHSLQSDGQLIVDIVLRNDRPYKCQVTTQDCSPSDDAEDASDQVDPV